MSTDIKPLSRQDEIQETLAKHGFRMEHSLAVFDGGGHAIMSIATGEQAEDEDLSPEVIALAEEWTVLEGPVVGEEAEAVADRIASRVLPPVPDRLTFQVWHDGDSSVGLPGDRSTVEIDLRSYAQADRRDYIEQVRESLQSSFGAIWGTRPKVMTTDEIHAEEAWLDGGGKSWKPGDTAKFGRNNERDVQVFSGLFRYSGMGMGNYYSASQRVDWIDTTEAQRKAKEEGVRFVYWDAEQAFDPAGYEATTGDKHVSMPESRFQWWRDQQAAWHKVATALQDHWSSRALDRGVEGVVDVIKTLAREASAYRALGRPESSVAGVAVDSAEPALQWFTLEQATPPEQKNVVAMLDSGIPILGRNIFGRFAEFDSVNDRFVDWMEGHENGFHGIKCWAEVVDPDQPANELNSRVLLAEARRYVESPEKVNVDWLMASIHRHLDGLSVCERPADPAATILEADEHLGRIGLPSYTQVVAALADAKPYVEASVRGEKSREFPNAYAYNMSRLAAVDQVLDKHRAVQEAPAPAAMPQPVSGFVLAFPGESQAVGDELLETLRMGGNTVYRVDDETAGPVLREVAASAGLDADDFQP